jgi:hypothetical protein
MELWNWMVKKYRIVVENAISEIKNWKIMKSEYQINSFDFDSEQLFATCVCGLVNTYTKKRRHKKFFERVETIK